MHWSVFWVVLPKPVWLTWWSLTFIFCIFVFYLLYPNKLQCSGTWLASLICLMEFNFHLFNCFIWFSLTCSHILQCMQLELRPMHFWPRQELFNLMDTRGFLSACHLYYLNPISRNSCSANHFGFSPKGWECKNYKFCTVFSASTANLRRIMSTCCSNALSPPWLTYLSCKFRSSRFTLLSFQFVWDG